MVSSRPAAWASTEMTLTQLLALHFISAKAPITLMSLSEALGTRPPATSAMVDRLARAGLVCRTPDPHDRRRILLAVTGRAVAMIGKIDLQTARRLQVMLNGQTRQTQPYRPDRPATCDHRRVSAQLRRRPCELARLSWVTRCGGEAGRWFAFVAP
jgi:DNA-binding MarR family transcriptional regulator